MALLDFPTIKEEKKIQVCLMDGLKQYAGIGQPNEGHWKTETPPFVELLVVLLSEKEVERCR